MKYNQGCIVKIIGKKKIKEANNNTWIPNNETKSYFINTLDLMNVLFIGLFLFLHGSKAFVSPKQPWLAQLQPNGILLILQKILGEWYKVYVSVSNIHKQSI